MSKKEATLRKTLAGVMCSALMCVPFNDLSAQVPPPAQPTRVVLLGTGTPNADPDRAGPALAIVVGGHSYLVDAGPGVVRRAAEAADKHGLEALTPERLTHVFLTHLHSDHTVGLPDLLYTPWVLDRIDPLYVAGPPGTAAMVDHLEQAFREDVSMRLFGLEPANNGGHRTEVSETRGGVVYEDERVRVTAFRVPHGSWPVALAYRFDTADRSIVVSGDTGPAPEVMKRACNGCDVLVHEVYAQAGWEGREPVWQRYHADFHTSGPDLGQIARDAGARSLVLTHQLLWGATPEQLLEEVRLHYSGPVHFGNDLDIH